MYKFSVDEQTCIISVEMIGFISDEDHDALERDFESAQERVRKAGGYLRLLVDGSQTTVLSTSVSERVSAMNSRFIRSDRDKIALVNSSALFKLQAYRLLKLGQLRIFDTKTEAFEWLIAN